MLRQITTRKFILFFAFLVLSVGFFVFSQINGFPKIKSVSNKYPAALTDVVPPNMAPVTSVKSGFWSDPAVWNGNAVPKAGDRVNITRGTNITYDVNSEAEIVEITIDGALTFSRLATTKLVVGQITVTEGGLLEVGAELSPIPDGVTATIVLVDLPSEAYTVNHDQERMAPVIHAHGGRVEMHGAPKAKTWIKLAQDANAGTKQIVLSEEMKDWRVGDRVVLSGTGAPVALAKLCTSGVFSNFDLSCIDLTSFKAEDAVIASISGKTITLQSSLQYTHLGTAPRQGEVGLLTHNVVITSKDPNGRRGHVHITENPETGVKGVGRFSYVEFSHLGRKKEPGVYPVHFHQLGNAGKDSNVKGISVWDSHNLGVRVHGTNFLRVADSVVYKVIGHGFANEDGSEVYNTFERNLSVRTMWIPSNINPNDPGDSNVGSGFWLSNARNYMRYNVATDADAWSFDYAIRKEPMVSPYSTPQVYFQAPLVNEAGISIGPVEVARVEVLESVGNEGHSSYLGGLNATAFNATKESRFVDFNMWAGTRWDVYPVHSINLTFERLIAGFVESYLSGQRDTKFVDSRINKLLFTSPYSGWGWLQRTVVGQLSSSATNSRVIVVDGDSRVSSVGFSTNSIPLGSTSQVEIYLLGYDGPGQHVKLIPKGTIAADTLFYTPSSRFDALEAKFTGNDGPPLALPLFIEAGYGKDMVDVDNRRLRIDWDYQAPPPGIRLPRYGHVGGITRNLDTTITGTTLVGSSFNYLADVPSGRYTVALLFREGWQGLYRPGGVGSRLFDVIAEGSPVLTNLDVFAEVGVGVPLAKAFQVDVADGQLTLEFLGRKGAPLPAMVSALAICPASYPECDFGSLASTPIPVPQPTVSLSANPTSITQGQSSTLTWSSTNVSSCTASVGWSGTKAVFGTQTVTPTQTTTYTLNCSGSGGSAERSTTVTVTQATDTTPPSIPQNLTTTVISSSQINLSWTASTDNVAVTGYRIYRSGTQIATSNTTSFQNTGLSPATNYAYTAAAYDAAGNVSNQSNQVSAITQPSPSSKFSFNDRIQVLSGPLSVRVTPSASGVFLGSQSTGALGAIIGGPTYADGFWWWNINYDTGTDGWSAENFLIKFTSPPPSSQPTATLSANPSSITSGQSAALSWSSANATSCTTSVGWSGTKAVSGTQSVSPTQTTIYTLTCTGSGGSASQSVTVTVTAAPPPLLVTDTQVPSIPQNLTAIAISPSQINLSWSASTDDNVGVVSYVVYRNSVRIASSTALSYIDSGLTAGDTHVYTVSAKDATENESSHSQSVFVLVPLSQNDTIPPDVISDVRAVHRKTRTISFEWSSPNDDSGKASSYEIRYLEDDSDIKTKWLTASNISNSINPQNPNQKELLILGNLRPATNYTIAIRSKDAKGNISDFSNVITIKTKAIPPKPKLITVQFGSVILSWTTDPYTDGSLIYRVIRSDLPLISATDTTAILIATTTQTTITDSSVIPNKTYYYGVVSYVDEGEYSSMETVTVTTPAVSTLSSTPAPTPATPPIPTSGGGGGGSYTITSPVNSTISISPNLSTTPIVIQSSQNVSNQTPAYIINAIITLPLYLGLRHPEVQILQEFLIKQGLLNIQRPTSYFGILTKLAVGEFQKKYGIVSVSGFGYGTVGPKTRQKITELSNATIQNQTSLSQMANSSIFSDTERQALIEKIKLQIKVLQLQLQILLLQQKGK